MASELPEPCYDAAECIQGLLEYLDVEYSAIVAGKLHHIQDMGSTTYELAHKGKSRARVYRDAAEQPPIVKVTSGQASKLSTLFRFYCQIGDKRSYQYMSRQQFLRFTRDASLVSYDTDLIELDLMFDKIKVLVQSGRGGNQLKFSEREFITAIASAAQRLYPEKDQQGAFDFVMEENVMPLFEMVDYEDVVGNILIQDNCLQLMHKYEKILNVVFSHYCSEDELVGVVEFKDRVAKQTMLSQGAVLKFAADFSIVPELLSTVKVVHCFKQSIFGSRAKQTQTLSNGKQRQQQTFITFNQFLECLARMALLAFNFQEKDPARHTVSFNGNSYSEHAKRLWYAGLSEMLAEVAPPIVESAPLEVRVISPTRRRADSSLGPAPPFLGHSKQPEVIDSLVAPSMNMDEEATANTMAKIRGRTDPGLSEELSEIERNLKKALTHTMTKSGRPVSSRGAARSRPPSANSRAEPLPQAYIYANPDKDAAMNRTSVNERVLFSSDWIGKPKPPLLGQRSMPLPELRYRNASDLYMTDGIMQPPANVPTVYHARMHEMVSRRVEREQEIDDMIMAWHLDGREKQQRKIQQKEAARLELMDKSCQLPGQARPRSGLASARSTMKSRKSLASMGSAPGSGLNSSTQSSTQSKTRQLKTSQEVFNEVLSCKSFPSHEGRPQ